MPLVLWHLVGHQEEHQSCKKLNDEVLVWLSVLSKMQMICIWCWCHCHPVICCFLRSRFVQPFWCLLTHIVSENRLLNGCPLCSVIDTDRSGKHKQLSVLCECSAFSQKHLGQIRTVYPTAYKFQQEKDLPMFGGKVSGFQLTIEAILDATADDDGMPYFVFCAVV